MNTIPSTGAGADMRSFNRDIYDLLRNHAEDPRLNEVWTAINTVTEWVDWITSNGARMIPSDIAFRFWMLRVYMTHDWGCGLTSSTAEL